MKDLLRAPAVCGSKRDVLASWHSTLRAFSPTLTFLLVGTILSSAGQWLVACVTPFFTGRLHNGVVDWGTVAYIHPDRANPNISLVFSTVAYFYMGLALFVYLAILAYAADLLGL